MIWEIDFPTYKVGKYIYQFFLRVLLRQRRENEHNEWQVLVPATNVVHSVLLHLDLLPVKLYQRGSSACTVQILPISQLEVGQLVGDQRQQVKANAAVLVLLHAPADAGMRQRLPVSFLAKWAQVVGAFLSAVHLDESPGKWKVACKVE